MPRPASWNPSRPALLALVVLLWSPIGGTTQAAGCHVPERPALGIPGDGGANAWEISGARPVAPPVLRRLPCPGEVPRASIATVVPAFAVDLATLALEPGLRSERMPAGDDAEAIPPSPSRLDRPPRGE